jgi:hypothetical protein
MKDPGERDLKSLCERAEELVWESEMKEEVSVVLLLPGRLSLPTWARGCKRQKSSDC